MSIRSLTEALAFGVAALMIAAVVSWASAEHGDDAPTHDGMSRGSIDRR
jgi:hypothetical protein